MLTLYIGVEMRLEGKSGLPLLTKLNMKMRLELNQGSRLRKGWSGCVCFREQGKGLLMNQIHWRGGSGAVGWRAESRYCLRPGSPFQEAKEFCREKVLGQGEPRLNKH